jgi:NADH-quinone oxidoreductase subunit E
MKKLTVEKILLEFDPNAENLLPALKKISAAFGFVGEKDAALAADYFSVPFAKVFETASFYDLINTKKPAGLVIQVCSSTNCVLRNSFSIIKEIEGIFHVKCGDENNPKVKLEEISCLGRCGEGPIVVVNGKVFTQVTTSSVHGILEEYL